MDDQLDIIRRAQASVPRGAVVPVLNFYIGTKHLGSCHMALKRDEIRRAGEIFTRMFGPQP
jgi:hypothetical protein